MRSEWCKLFIHQLFFFSLLRFQIVEQGLQASLVIEDDLRFEVFFKRRLKNLLSEVQSESLNWDLM